MPVDFAPPYYQLVALPLKESIPFPKFTSSVIAGPVDKKGLSLYYSDHCPHTSKYAPILADIACKQSISVSLHKFTSATQAQSSPNPFTSWAMFWNGDFITNEIFSPDKMRHFLEKNQ